MKECSPAVTSHRQEVPDCSGEFEFTSGVNTDPLKLDSGILNPLIDCWWLRLQRGIVAREKQFNSFPAYRCFP